ncbi:protein kinase, partial [Streptosporangium sp. NPDC048865]|uniref:protein kinase domain-containing protein n=1 Tax=Streptosporangium sp. NPDC048865 TaxID=3155766 RepID=UPI003442CD79
MHRDVKPENVLLADDGRVVLTDFGIASMTQETGITRTGAMVGTPAFLPPERLHGLPATPESDLWSLGATLYAALEGRPPFERATAAATMMAVLHGEPGPMSESGPLRTVILGLMARDPAARMAPDEAEALLGGVSSPGPVPGRAARPGQRAHPSPGSSGSPGAPVLPAGPLPRQEAARDTWRPGHGDSFPGGPGQPPVTPAPVTPTHPGHSPYAAGHTRPQQQPYADHEPYARHGQPSSSPSEAYADHGPHARHGQPSHPQPEAYARHQQPPHTRSEPYAPPYTQPEPHARHGHPSYPPPEAYARHEPSPYTPAHHGQPSHTHPGQRAHGPGSPPPGSWPGPEHPTDTGTAPARRAGARRPA